LFFAVKDAFGFTYPNYGFPALAAVCAGREWSLAQTRFYTGIPDPTDNHTWNHFWAGKLLQMSRDGVHTFSRPLRYRNKTVRLPDGSTHAFLTGEEKGVDVRIAIDVIRLAHHGDYDVALLFSQDQDLSELCAEIRTIAREQNRCRRFSLSSGSQPTPWSSVSPPRCRRPGIRCKNGWAPRQPGSRCQPTGTRKCLRRSCASHG